MWQLLEQKGLGDSALFQLRMTILFVKTAFWTVEVPCGSWHETQTPW